MREEQLETVKLHVVNGTNTVTRLAVVSLMLASSYSPEIVDIDITRPEKANVEGNEARDR